MFLYSLCTFYSCFICLVRFLYLLPFLFVTLSHSANICPVIRILQSLLFVHYTADRRQGLTDCKFRHASPDAGMMRNKLSKLFVCWFAAKKKKKKEENVNVWEDGFCGCVESMDHCCTENMKLSASALVQQGWQLIRFWPGAFCFLSSEKIRCEIL